MEVGARAAGWAEEVTAEARVEAVREALEGADFLGGWVEWQVEVATVEVEVVPVSLLFLLWEGRAQRFEPMHQS